MTPRTVSSLLSRWEDISGGVYSHEKAAGGGKGKRVGLCPVCCPRCDTRGEARRVHRK